MGKLVIVRSVGWAETNLFNVITLLCNSKLKVNRKIESRKTPFTMAKKLKIMVEVRGRELHPYVNAEL